MSRDRGGAARANADVRTGFCPPSRSGYIWLMREWSIRDAKDRLSELVEAAAREPQAITKHGRAAVVVLSQQEFDRLVRPAEPLASFFGRSGFDEVEIERVEAAVRENEQP